MSQVPSIFSSQLGRFVRRSRENELELQTVGSPSLERRIQALFGGTQVKNLPQPLQQIIAQDRGLTGSGRLSGPLTLINPFTNDDLTPDQQKAAANQMAIQQGANPPFPEVQQPREQNSVEEAARQAATSIQPLVQQGLLSQRDAQGTVRSVVLDNVLDVDERRRAAVDVKALSQQFRSGQLNIQQVAKTTEQLNTKYGRAVLNAIPEWRELTGTEDQFRSQVREAVKAKADSFGLPVDAFRFDAKSGAVVRNNEWFEIDAYKTKKTTEAAKPVLEANNAARKAAQVVFDTDKRQLEKQYQANFKSDPAAAVNIFNSGLRSVTTVFQDTISGINTPGGAAAQPALQPAAPPQAPVSVQGLPPGVTLFGAFPDVQSVINTSPPTGSYFTIGGVLGRRRVDGRYEPVQ